MWFKSLYEKLGWMVLAKDYHMNEKVKEYKYSIRRIKMVIKNKIKEVHDPDKKDDLKIMYDKICILEKHARKDFK